RLRQVLVNLIGNALKFTEEGGVAVRGRLTERTADGVSLRMEVADTGIGIPEEKHHQVFGMFSQADASTTRRYGGTGLGLAICERFVELMGGEIGLESTPGQGSTFWFTISLPVAREAPAPQASEGRPAVTSPGAREGSGKKVVLVAEDNAVNQKVVATMLRRHDYEVEIAEDGAGAVEAARSGRYAAILMDCRMPVMDGYEASRRIRRIEGTARHTPIIALTASAMESDRQNCIEAGMDDFLAKPVKQADLVAAVARWVSDEKLRA
ncbi:MAG: ATP-binding protein, partial [Actinomycetota bacterium]